MPLARIAETTSAEAGGRSGAEPPSLLPDRRRHIRYPLTLLGRFMRASREEFPCKMIDFSVGGIGLMSPVEVAPGERVVAYFDMLGGLEGNVVRRYADGFAIELSVTPHKREKLAAQVTWLLHRDMEPGRENRRHERIPAEKSTTLKVGDAEPVTARVIDVSISGAAIQTDLRAPLGADVMVGRLRARVIRQSKGVLAVEFVDIQRPDAVRRYFG